MKPSVAIVLGLVLQVVTGIACAFALLDAAYAYPGVGALDELRRLGDAPKLGALTLVVIGALAVVVTLALASRAATRHAAAVVPLVGVIATVAATAIAIGLYQEPAPIPGG